MYFYPLFISKQINFLGVRKKIILIKKKKKKKKKTMILFVQ